MADWVEFFARQTPPGNLKEVRATVSEFAGTQRAAGRDIVFVTVSCQSVSTTGISCRNQSVRKSMHIRSLILPLRLKHARNSIYYG